MIDLGILFHCNSRYSSFSLDEPARALADCYWPLLRLAAQYGSSFPMAFELSGETLLELDVLDPLWVKQLARLQKMGRVEVLCGGYAQIPMPLVPCAINRINLHHGQVVFRELLGMTARGFYPPELVVSALVPGLAAEAGFDYLLVEWQNVSRYRPELRFLRYQSQVAGSAEDELQVGVIWADSVAWQQFQRAVWGEQELARYIGWLSTHFNQTGYLLAYASDAEAFRGPERQARLEELTAWLVACDHIPKKLPGQVKIDWAAPPITLSSAAYPLATKKQPKYNPLRWATSGPDTARRNAECLRLTRRWESSGIRDAALERRLLSLWGSDYRTHTHPERVTRYEQDRREVQAMLAACLPKK